MGMRREDYAPLAVQDDLTGLHNRRSLVQQLKARDPGAPAALVLFDFEGFRAVNEHLGRSRGDRLLQDFAERVRTATEAGDTFARHGGDSFALLLPGRTRDEAAAFVDQFIVSLDNPPLLEEAEKLKANPPVTAGIAAFPDDGASPEAVLQAATRALHAGRQAGGRRIGVSGKLADAPSAERRKLEAFPCPLFLGRSVELESADTLVDDLKVWKPALLLVEGDPGSGKSRYLDEIVRKAGRAEVQVLRLAGAASRKQVAGGAFLAAVHRHFSSNPRAVQDLGPKLSPAQKLFFSDLVPALGSWRPEGGPPPPEPVPRGESLKELFAAMAGQRPFLFVVDGANHVDRGTFDLIRSLVDDPNLAVGAVLAIAGDAKSIRPERDRALLEFILDYTKSLKMRAVSLGPLPMTDLLRMIDALLPGARLPDAFGESLGRASKGNPLYVTEALRSMALRGRIQRTGEGWKVAPLERADLPADAGEALRAVYEALPADVREVAASAAVLGAHFDLPTLQETLGLHEAAVFDGVDVAAEAGLFRPVPDATADDWEFSSGTARDVRYLTLTTDARLRIHRRASAVLRMRAVDQAGVRAEMIFHAQVARGAFELAEVEESTEPSRPARPARLEEAKFVLPPESMEAALAFLDALKAAVRLRRIYPQWNQVAKSYGQKAWNAWSALAAKAGRVTFSTAPREFRVNGQGQAVDSATELPELRLLLVDRLVGSLTMTRELEERELDALVAGLAAPMDKSTASSDHWDRLIEAEGLPHLDVVQRRFASRESETTLVRLSSLAPERLLRGEDLKLLWRALRFLKGAAENLRLYPPGQELTDESFRMAASSVDDLLEDAGRITVASSEEGLLINGLASAPDDGPDVAAFFADEFRAKRLRSFSLTTGAPQDEIRVLVSVLAVADVVTAEGIIAATRTRHLAFQVQDDRVTEERTSDLHLPSVGAGDAADRSWIEEESEPIPIAPVRNASPAYLVIRVDLRARAALVSPTDYFLSERSEKELPLMIETLRFGDLGDLADAIVKRLGGCLAEPEAAWRRRAILMATRLLGDATGDSQDKLITAFREPLQACLLGETDKDALRLLTEAVRLWAKGTLDARRLPLLAGFIASAVRPKLDSVATPRDFKIGLQSKLQTLAADGGGDPALEMLRSSQAPLRHTAIQILSVLGPPMIPALVEIVATHPSADVRRMSAVALKEVGGTAQQDLARIVRADATSLKAIRALEFLELAGPGNIATPVHEALRHPDPAVGKEAVKLVKRADRPMAVAALRWVMMKDDLKVRLAALDVVREMKLAELGPDVSRLLQEPADESLLKAALKALATVPSPAAAPHLKRIFEQKRGPFGFVKGLSDETRALAVAAAAAIDHPDTHAIVAQAEKDRSDVVRSAAVRKK